MKNNKEKIYYYKNYNEDIIKSSNQNYELPKDYIWINNSIIYKMKSKIIYFIAKIFGYFYCKFGLKVKFVNNKILKDYKKQGYFVYGNHTQILGDVFIPSQISKTKRIYTIVSPANLGVKVIGKILPELGALPIPKAITEMKKFTDAIKYRIKENKAVIIYPEAHVWPYYTKIREFENTSFKFPVECNVPAFCMTTTYYKRKFSKKPGIKVYIDGPFFSNEQLNKKQRQEELRNKIYNCMLERSKNSNYEYVKYVKIEQD